MPALSDYVSGTITLTNGSNAFTGTGTGWEAADFREGDTILGIEDHAGVEYVIATIDGNGSGTLTQNWEGATGTYTYRMRYMADGARVTAQARNLIELLGNGNLQSIAGLTLGSGDFIVGTGGGGVGTLAGANLQAIAGLTGAADTISYYTGPAAKALTPLTSFARTLLDDANADAARGTLGVAEKQASLTDGTAGRGLLVGGFGIGGGEPPALSSNDLDTAVLGGAWSFAIGATNAPFTASGSVFVFPGPGAGITQLAFRQNVSVMTDAIYIRYRGATWTNWFKVFHQGSILGTVSQTAGVPTGAIIEQGSNANGEYIRFADGTQFALIQGTTGSGSLPLPSGGVAGDFQWNYPATFASTPFLQASSAQTITSGGGRIALVGAGGSQVSATFAQGYRFNTDAAAKQAGPVSVFAIGRWF